MRFRQHGVRSLFDGQPVYVVDLESRRDSKFGAFHRSLKDAGITRPFDGTLDTWSYEPLDETARVAAELRRRMDRANHDA